MREQLDGLAFRDMVISAAASVDDKKQEINELNVFPVPDGDTGTNMSLTLNAAATELKNKQPHLIASISAAAEVAAGAMLRGARGNSGVILSLLFRGMSKALKEKKTADACDFAFALSEGVNAAYKAVMKPSEGTILTVSRLAAAAAVETAAMDNDIDNVLVKAIDAGRTALENTVNLNPVLKKAGVIDAGGMGYMIMLEAAAAALKGEIRTVSTSSDTGKSVFTKFETEDIKFGYCTEFIVRRDNDKSPDLLRSFLGAIGDSIVVLEDEEVIKVHVHANNPGEVLTEALTFGALLSVKIENMREQHSSKLVEAQEAQETEANDKALEEPEIAEPEKEFGVVAVCAGEGLANLFKDLGADGVVSGGQTMNPATEDILRQINKTPANTVFVLPNNSNIFMAAEQCAQLTTKQVVVIRTTTVQQGIAAMLALEYDKSVDENKEAMLEVIKGVTSISVTYAARDSVFDGVQIKEGDYLVLQEKKILCTEPQLEPAIEYIAQSLRSLNTEVLSVFYGEDVDEAQAKELVKKLEEALPDVEISLVNGGQPVYYYLISAE